MLKPRACAAINRRGLGPFTLPMILLYIVSAVAMLIFILVLLGYMKSNVPRLFIPNEGQMLANYVADALISLPNWDGKCGCLAKSVNTPEGEVIYPGLLPTWKLEALRTNGCENFCTLPYFIDQTKAAKMWIVVKDLDRDVVFVGGSGTSDQENITITRLVAIEDEHGIVHAGRMSVSVYYG